LCRSLAPLSRSHSRGGANGGGDRGGVDLSIASMMAVTSVTAAVLMNGASEEMAFLVVPFVLAVGFGMGAINGALIVITRVRTSS
jgi:ribose/xylose/arabinose/galactoside ABC-type transport system permease subunit